jgi:hypothetical protein
VGKTGLMLLMGFVCVPVVLRLADVFQTGTYRLEAANLLPILKTLMGWKYDFHSPFNARCLFRLDATVDRSEVEHG